MMATPGHNSVSYGKLLAVLGALLVLTALTVLLSKVRAEGMHVWFVLGIASLKSSLVLMYFMHMKYESRAVMITFLVTVCLIAVLIGFMFWDVAFRS